MQVTQEQTKIQTSVIQRRQDAVKSLEEWRKRYGHKLKGWDVVGELRKWRDLRK